MGWGGGGGGGGGGERERERERRERRWESAREKGGGGHVNEWYILFLLADAAVRVDHTNPGWTQCAMPRILHLS